MRRVCILAIALQVIAITLQITFIQADILTPPEGLYNLMAVRLAMLALTLGTLYTTYFDWLFRKHYPYIAISFFTLLSLGACSLYYLADPGLPIAQTRFAALMLITMSFYIFTILPAWQAVLSGLAIFLMYLFALVYSTEASVTTLTTDSFLLIATNIVCALGVNQRNQHIAKSFLLQQKLTGSLERIEAEKRVDEYWSNHDILTGLPNRKYFMKELQKRIDASRLPGAKIGLLFVDLDGFKEINDNFGHAVGDKALNIMARRLEGSVRSSDFVARFGGDEFVAVLSLSQSPSEAALRVAKNILRSAEQSIRDISEVYTPSASIGIAFYPDDATDAESLLHIADERMYESKRKGRGKISVADPMIENKIVSTS